MKLSLAGLLMIIHVYAIGQIGIGVDSPDPSAIMEINSADKGLLIPKVPLQSKFDKETIPNPEKGLIVIASEHSGTGISAIYQDRLYVFSGNQWDEILENNTNYIDFLYPKLVAAGRKTTTNTDCSGLNNNHLELDVLEPLDGNEIFTDGSIKPARKGYYAWSIQLEFIMRKNQHAPYISPGLLSFEFRRGVTTTSSPQFVTFSGTVFLDENEISPSFEWFLGNNLTTDLCTSENKIGKQTVIWKYLGE